MIPPILAALILAAIALVPPAAIVQHLRDDTAEAKDLQRLKALADVKSEIFEVYLIVTGKAK